VKQIVLVSSRLQDARSTQHAPPAACCLVILEYTRMLMTILVILLILALVGGLPRWGYSRSWGYGPSGILGVVVVILLVLWLLGRL
jgi:hypothetical protein